MKYVLFLFYFFTSLSFAADLCEDGDLQGLNTKGVGPTNSIILQLSGGGRLTFNDIQPDLKY
jgi:hypothetical protein